MTQTLPSDGQEPGPRRPLRLGVFDSGVGGLSVLRELRRELPCASLVYVADSGHAPYGERSDDFVAARSQRIAGWLVEAGCDAVVVACNTATAVAVEALRTTWPALPIVGVEPGLKPATALTRNGRIGVMATAATLRSARFLRLLDAHAGGASVHLQPCPGLAQAIEHHDAGTPGLLRLIDDCCAPLRDAAVDVVVLGCTHYPLVRAAIQSALGSGVAIIDTAEAVARQAARRCAGIDSAAAETAGADPTAVQLRTTGEPAGLQRVARRWLPFAFETGAPLAL